MINSARCVMFVICVLVFTSLALAQTQITTGTIQGTILDQSGAVVTEADVVASNLNTQSESIQKTDGEGHFVFLALPPGRYSVTVTKQGFTKVIQKDVDLTVVQALTLKLTLKVSATNETVVVTGTPLIATTQTETSITLDEQAVQETPILGRKFEDLLTLTPGVSVVQG